MALYSRHDYLNLRPFHGFGDAGVPPDPDAGSIDGVPQSGLGIDLTNAYQAAWPGVVGSALTLWPGAAPLIGDATPLSPLANAPPPLVASASAMDVARTPTWMWIALAAAGYWFFLRK